eukprot:6269058-Prymnesium_polylepis.1
MRVGMQRPEPSDVDRAERGRDAERGEQRQHAAQREDGTHGPSCAVAADEASSELRYGKRTV